MTETDTKEDWRRYVRRRQDGQNRVEGRAGGTSKRLETVAGAALGVRGSAHDRARRDDRERGAAGDTRLPRLLGRGALVGGERLPAHLRRLPPLGREGRRPLRAQAGLRLRARPLHVCLAFVRARGKSGALGRGARVAGGGRRHHRPRCAFDHHHHLYRARVEGEGDGRLGVLLGGVLTQTMGWPWIFFVNLPVGLAALALCRPLLDPDPKPDLRGGFDLPGAFLVTASLVDAVYAIVGVTNNPPALTAFLFLVAAALMVAFAAVERRAEVPLVPPGIFARSRNLTVSNVVMALAVVGMVGWFFFSALYLQRVLGYDSLATGLSYLPATLALGAISQGPAAWAVGRYGIKPTVIGGLGLMATGLLLFARTPVVGTFLVDVLPGMLVLAAGASFAFMAVILASTTGVPGEEAGLASGLVNTSQQMGGALGLAALAAVSAAYTAGIAGSGSDVAVLNAGYHAAFLAGAGCVVLAAVIAATLLRLPNEADPE